MQEGCTVNLTVKYLTKKWMLLVILELFKGENHTRRFGGLKESIPGITPKILSARLKELEDEGLIKRHVETGNFPARSEYTLTESGLEIVDIIKGIKKWALKWKIDNIACGNQACENCIL